MIYNKLNLKCIPKPIFAHVYSCPGYQLKLKRLTPNIEIAYIKEGELSLEILGREYVAKEKSFIVLPHNYEFFIHSQKNVPHIHYTMSAVMGEESILTEGKIDLSKFHPITYDPMNHHYISLGEKVGNAFSDGKQLQ